MRLPNRQHGRANSLVRVRVSHRHAICQRLHFCTRLLNGYAGRKPREHHEVAGVAVAQHPSPRVGQLAVHRQRHPHLVIQARACAVETFGGDTDNRERRAVDAKSRPNGGAIRVILVLPIAVADDNNRVSVLRVVAFRVGEETPSLRLHAKHVEKAPRHHFTPNLGGLRGIAHRKDIPNPRCHQIHKLQIVAEIAEVQVRRGDGFAVRRHVLDGHNAFRLRGAGQRIQKHWAHPTKDGGARPDANPNCKNCYRGKGGISRQCPYSVTKVAQ